MSHNYVSFPKVNNDLKKKLIKIKSSAIDSLREKINNNAMLDIRTEVS